MNAVRYVLLLLLILAGCTQTGSTTPTPLPTATLGARITLLPRSTETATPAPTRTPTLDPDQVRGRLVGDSVPLRLQPGTANPVDWLIQGSAPVTVIGRTDDTLWIEVALDTGATGWLEFSDVAVPVQMSRLPVTGVADDLPPTPLPDAVVRQDADGLRLRLSPGLTTDVRLNLEGGTVLDVIGRTTDNQWLEVMMNIGISGWVSAQFLDVFINLESLPVTGVVVVTPAAEIATPTPAATIEESG